MKNYEIMYIIKSSLEEESRNTIIENLHEIILSNKGVINDINQWGLKEFAYPIDKETKGFYVVVNFSCDPTTLAEFDRLLGINANVVRYMITKKED